MKPFLMPIFFQHRINDSTRLGVWKIEETEEFFKSNVTVHREVTHPHKRLQHLAGRFLLQFLFPGFPYDLVKIADTRKPFLPDEEFHFSISHCGDYAAAIVSTNFRVGIDIEIPVEKIGRMKGKFLNEQELARLGSPGPQLLTTLWSAKEAVFKWYGNGGVDFREHIHLNDIDDLNEHIRCHFSKTGTELSINFHRFDQLVLCWTMN